MSSRLQPRRSVKTVLNYYEGAQDTEDDYDSDDGHDHPTLDPRRGKTKPERSGFDAKQTRRRRSGKLSKFPTMPLDVMYEVCPLLLCQCLCLDFRSPDLLVAPPSGFVEGVLDNENISGRSDRPFVKTDLEDVVGFC